MRRTLIAANWKMNGLRESGVALAREIATRAVAPDPPGCDIVVCPPAPLLVPVGEALGGGPVALGGQDCHPEPGGAFTGDTAAPLLADLGCRYVIVGHSERRQGHGEGDATVRAKAVAAQGAGLIPIVCVGETEAERAAGEALAVIARQVTGSMPDDGVGMVLAYEPVWAIGTGKVATPEDVAEAHGHIRAVVAEKQGKAVAERLRLLYGGSVKPDNAAGLLALADVDGALVGGASLKAVDFWAICQAAP